MKSGREVIKGGIKEEQKIIGTMIAVILVASVVLMAPVGIARDPANGNIQSGDTLFCGESGLSFNTTDLPNVVRLEGRFGDAEGEVITIADPTNFYIPCDTKEGIYDIIDVNGNDIGDLTIKKPSISGDVFLAGTTDSIVGKSIPVGQPITIQVDVNFGGLLRQSIHSANPGEWGTIDIKLYDPDGIQLISVGDTAGNTIQLTDIPADVSQIDIDNITTTGWETGEYTLKISSNPETCNDVDIESVEYKFTLRKEELSIDVEDDVVSRSEDIIVNICGNPETYYYLIITDVIEEEPPSIEFAGDVVDLPDTGEPGAENVSVDIDNDGVYDHFLAAWIQTDVDGTATVIIDTTDADERTYTIRIYHNPVQSLGYDGMYGTADDDILLNPVQGGPEWATERGIADSEDVDKVDVKVEKRKVTFDIPSTAVIGETVTIRGTISAGETVDILIDDGDVAYFDDVPVDENKEFEVDWDTDGLTEGSYMIDIYIDCDCRDYDCIQREGLYPDGLTTIRLVIIPELHADISKSIVLLGESFEVYGDASSDYVEIITISPRGGYGIGLDGLYGVSIYTVPLFKQEKTSTKTDSYKIESFLNENYSVEKDVSSEESDGSTPIHLIVPGLTVNISTNEIHPGGSFVINGTATGTDYVDIITISPKGGCGAGLYEERYPDVPGITNESVPVDENCTFSKMINVSEYADTGEYVIWVSVPGRDGCYGDGYGDNASDILNYIIDYYCGGDANELRSKTQDQILDMLKDATINIAGSDDLACIMELSVEYLSYIYKKIKVDSSADTGNYTILVLSPGIDCVYGDSLYKYMDNILDLDGAGPELGAIDVSNKTKEEIVKIIEDATVNAAGSDDLIWMGNITVSDNSYIDTGQSPNPYPSIFGTHNGTIIPANDITASKIFVYPCVGTGGHAEYVRIWGNGVDAHATWNGYGGEDWNILHFNRTFTLEAGKEYNFTIKTGSYPQIFHEEVLETLDGSIVRCEEFVDANGKRHKWIPAFKIYA